MGDKIRERSRKMTQTTKANENLTAFHAVNTLIDKYKGDKDSPEFEALASIYRAFLPVAPKGKKLSGFNWVQIPLPDEKKAALLGKKYFNNVRVQGDKMIAGDNARIHIYHDTDGLENDYSYDRGKNRISESQDWAYPAQADELFNNREHWEKIVNFSFDGVRKAYPTNNRGEKLLNKHDVTVIEGVTFNSKFIDDIQRLDVSNEFEVYLSTHPKNGATMIIFIHERYSACVLQLVTDEYKFY